MQRGYMNFVFVEKSRNAQENTNKYYIYLFIEKWFKNRCKIRVTSSIRRFTACNVCM